MTGIDIVETQFLKNFLNSQFRIKDLGDLHYLLGIEIIRKLDGVLLTQQKFALDLLGEFNCDTLKPFQSPLQAGIKLYSNDIPPINDPAAYRRLIGKLNYLTHTLLDIAFAVQYLSQFMASLR